MRRRRAPDDEEFQIDAAGALGAALVITLVARGVVWMVTGL
ncbi:MAG: hypothetical protein ACPGQD_03415 [Planctomycetota bacterium]